MEYAKLDPFGEDRADWRAAMLAQRVLASAGCESKISDHFPRFGPDPEPAMAQEEMIRACAMWAQVAGIAGPVDGAGNQV